MEFKEGRPIGCGGFCVGFFSLFFVTLTPRVFFFLFHFFICLLLYHAIYLFIFYLFFIVYLSYCEAGWVI